MCIENAQFLSSLNEQQQMKICVCIRGEIQFRIFLLPLGLF